MLAKLTSKNQLTLPKAVIANFVDTNYFDVSVEGGRIILSPLRASKVDAVRSKLAALGIDESDVAKAVQWARKAK